MTAEQVEGSLITIKTDLATRAMSGIAGDRIEQRLVLKLAATEDGGDANETKKLLIGDDVLEKEVSQKET